MVKIKQKKAQAVIVGIMIFIMVFIAVVAFIEPMKDTIDLARDSDHLDCSNSSIGVGRKSSCIIVDMGLPYFVAIAIASGAAFLTGKKLSS